MDITVIHFNQSLITWVTAIPTRKLLCNTRKLVRIATALRCESPALCTTVMHDAKTVTKLMRVTVNEPLLTLRQCSQRSWVVKDSGAQHSNWCASRSNCCVYSSIDLSKTYVLERFYFICHNIVTISGGFYVVYTKKR